MKTPKSDYPVSSQPYPWQIREMPYGLKVLVAIGFAILLVIALYGFLSMLYYWRFVSQTRGEKIFADLLSYWRFPVAAGGAALLWRPLRMSASFQPKTGPTDPQTPLHAFSVQFEPPSFVHTLLGDGSIVFTKDELSFDGMLPLNVWLQAILALLLMCAFVTFFQCGMIGIFPAFLIAFFIGRKRISKSVRYDQMYDLSLQGTTLDLKCADLYPERLRFRVSSQDGERLYHELHRHMPQVVSEWEPLLSARQQSATTN